MSDKLQTVRHYVAVGLNLPPLKRFPRPTRWLARLAARGVRYLSRVVTDWQREFNQGVLHVLEDLEGTVSRLEQVQQTTQRQFLEQWQNYAAAVHQHAALLEQHTASLQQQQAALQRQAVLLEEHEVALEAGSLVAKPYRDGGETFSVPSSIGIAASHEALDRFRRELAVEQQRLTLLAEQVRMAQLEIPPDVPSERSEVPGRPAGLEGLGAALEARFRSSREEIKGHLQVYLPLLAQGGIGTEDMPVVYLGCERAEWLELLHEHGLRARGVELNHNALADSRQRGFDVHAGDALKYLRSLPDASQGAVTAFHLVEHLPFETVVQVLSETVRALKPGGLVILETPNPQNLLLRSLFSHAAAPPREPVMPATLRLLAEQRGLSRVEVWAVNGRSQSHAPGVVPENQAAWGLVLETLRRHLESAPDYAVIAWKV
jgi:SAM-dependent methyltransferase